MQRFLVSDLSQARPGDRPVLEEEEVHHLRNVLRAAPGEELELFDGAGWCGRGVVEEVARRAVQVQLTSLPVCDPPDPRPLWLAVASPKADRLRWLVEKATELGVERVIPLRTERTVVHPGPGKRQQMKGAIVQACKQCGRNRLMELTDPVTWEAFWQERRTGEGAPATRLYIADRSGRSLSAIREEEAGKPAGKTIVLIGPEGGFTATELQEAQERGATAVSLGRYILRIETAALAAAACCTLLTCPGR